MCILFVFRWNREVKFIKITKPSPIGEYAQKNTHNIASGGVHGVWDNQAGSQKWLPTPNASDRLNSDSPSRRD